MRQPPFTIGGRAAARAFQFPFCQRVRSGKISKRRRDKSGTAFRTFIRSCRDIQRNRHPDSTENDNYGDSDKQNAQPCFNRR